MQKNLRMAIMIMMILSILLLLLIIGPETSGTIMAANSNVDSLNSDETVDKNKDSLNSDVVDSSVMDPTQSAIENDKSVSDVTCEITDPEVAFQLKYNQYPLTYTYLLVQNGTINIRKGPSLNDPVLKAIAKYEKLNYIETITNDSKWYHIAWRENDQHYFGFVSADVVTKRVFQFDKMLEAVRKSEKVSEQGSITYINNYHNLKGYAPSYKGQDLDSNGNRRSQSAPGYPDPARLDEFSYLGDGTLVKVLSSDAQYTKVALVKDEKVYFVPNKYVITPAAITEIKKAVVVDRTNQNEVVFEKMNQEWNVVSFTLATTGTVGQYQQPTPLGVFYGIEKRERFYYYKDGTTKIQGYAPYAIRFAGGAYIHGVPVNYKFSADGKRIDPGKIEYSKTVGTIPLSHKCVRNYTSHAKFLYDWYTPGEMIVIVIE